jgi:hypothetical protein
MWPSRPVTGRALLFTFLLPSFPVLTENGQKYENATVLLYILLRTQAGLDAKILVVGTESERDCRNAAGANMLNLLFYL